MLEQPAAFVPVTVYTVLTGGVTMMLEMLEPVFQEYDVAPLAVNVAELPLQIGFVIAVTDTLGKEFTVTLTVCELAQPNALKPFTVKMVEVAGKTFTGLEVNVPGFQV